MYIFTRYIVTEILIMFFVILLAITLLVTVAMGIKEGASRGCPPLVVLHLVPYMLPEMLVITIPVSLLLSVSIVYGRMTGTNEIVAIKSLGISPMDVIWPTIVLALIFSIATLYLQELAATWGRPNVIRVATESIEEIAYGMLQKYHNCTVPPNGEPLFRITVKDVEGRKLIRPTITIFGHGAEKTVTLRAEKATLETDLKANAVNIKCWKGEIDYGGQGGVAIKFYDEREQSIPIPPPIREEYHRDWVAMREVPDKLAKLQGMLWEIEQQRSALALQNQSLPPFEEERSKELYRLACRLRTEPYRRLSNGFTCLCFVLIGAPVAMLWRHADVLTNFFVCFLPILAIYYPLLMIGEDLSTSGKYPPISFWMGNITLIVSGIVLLKWVVKH
jgi:lipopolysaccharide export system permease protein